MKKIQELLSQNNLVTDWRLTETSVKSYELFFVHKNLETVRATDTVTTEVTVYQKHDGKMGHSSFAVTKAMDEETLKKKIEAAAMRSSLVFNEPYELPDGGQYETELPTNMKDEDPRVLGKKIADAVFAADHIPGGSINACEIFLYRDTKRVENSKGLNKTQKTWRVMIEAIPTFTQGSESVELYEDYRFTTFDPQQVTEEISRRMEEVRDRFTARKPQTPMTVHALLRPQEIQELMASLATWDLNYSTVYSHGNLHKIGDDLQPDSVGDKITITMRAATPGSERSAQFDEDGTELTDTCLVENGVVKSYFGANRFGQYLGVEKPSGTLACMKLDAGSMTKEDARKQPYLELASLSGLQVDLFNDYIGGEIRLAYYFDGEKTLPVSGISMSGKLSDVLSSLRLSNRVVTDGSYEGPDYLLMKNIAVL